MEKRLARIWLLQSLLNHTFLPLWPSPFRSSVPESCRGLKFTVRTMSLRPAECEGPFQLLLEFFAALSLIAFLSRHLGTALLQVLVCADGGNEKAWPPALRHLEQSSKSVTRLQHEEVHTDGESIGEGGASVTPRSLHQLASTLRSSHYNTPNYTRHCHTTTPTPHTTIPAYHQTNTPYQHTSIPTH